MSIKTITTTLEQFYNKCPHLSREKCKKGFIDILDKKLKTGYYILSPKTQYDYDILTNRMR